MVFKESSTCVMRSGLENAAAEFAAAESVKQSLWERDFAAAGSLVKAVSKQKLEGVKEEVFYKEKEKKIHEVSNSTSQN
ncbi:hypothetical protein OIU77_000125 [Salix suchowensis]|uniref:Uncharacterized protein n=1 Tax=Salix suchowensis TaxID=1278906 RepID=A0ABQ9B525_9ROSI|nr:hypothetical protein OIU77_000125 [Salix suchowensis]